MPAGEEARVVLHREHRQRPERHLDAHQLEPRHLHAVERARARRAARADRALVEPLRELLGRAGTLEPEGDARAARLEVRCAVREELEVRVQAEEIEALV